MDVAEKEVSGNVREKKAAFFPFVALFLLSGVMMFRQLKTPGYFSCKIEDTLDYTSWASQFVGALREGVLYPRWTAIDFWGYGSPTFILYPPLAFYLVALFDVFTGSFIAAMNITKFASLFILGMGMFLLVEEFFPRRVALMSAVFYVIFPYQILGLYMIGPFASMVSLMWFPLVLLFVHKYIKGGRFRHIVYAGVCYGGLILTQLIIAYMFTFVLVAFIVVLSISYGRKRRLIAGPLVVVTGLLTSAAYILPLLYEKRFVNLTAFAGEGSRFDFENFMMFPNIVDIIPSDNFWSVYHNTFLFYLFFFGMLMGMFLLLIMKVNYRDVSPHVKTIAVFSLGVSLLSLFFLFGPSTFLWKGIPFFRYIRYPIRWLNITVFAIVFLSAPAFYTLEILHKANSRKYLFVALLFLICILMDYRYVSSAAVFAEGELIPVHAVNDTREHLPAGVDTQRLDKAERLRKEVAVIRGEGEAEILIWKSVERVIGIRANGPITLRVRTFNFPGWTAYVDGARSAIQTQDGSHAMLIDVPTGRHTLLLRFVETPIRKTAMMLTLAAALVLVITVIASTLPHPRRSSKA